VQELGFTSWFSRNMTLENSLRHLSAAKCRQVEVAAMPEYLARWKSIRTSLDSRCMSVSAVSLGVPFYYSDGKLDLHSKSKTVRDGTLRFVRRGIEFASRINARLIYACSMTRGTPEERGRTLENLSMLVADCAAYAERAGVRFGMEPFPTGELRTISETGVFIDSVGTDNLGMVIDTGHAAITGESMSQSIRSSFGHIVHVHLNNNDGKRDLHWPPQKGRLMPGDFEEVLRTLRERGYRGNMSVELSRPRPVVRRVLESRAFVDDIISRLDRPSD